MIALCQYGLEHIVYCETMHFLLGLGLSLAAAVPILTIFSRVRLELGDTPPSFLLFFISSALSWLSHITADTIGWGF